ncbi:hypothetical protein ATO2_12970 [Roseovarius sp. 22II1-1F6A]|nr:hypothetical protein ATO2_12970 [Roseovarius sp. 22II1-1F6A]
MSDEVWKRDEIESPCIKVCVIDPKSRLCLGCLRSINEIGGWSLMSADERRAVMADLPARKDQVAPRRRGGRAARLRRSKD